MESVVWVKQPAQLRWPTWSGSRGGFGAQVAAIDRVSASNARARFMARLEPKWNRHTHPQPGIVVHQLYGSAMRPDDPPGDRQTESGPGFRTACGQAMEGLEDLGPLVCRDSWALIRDLQPQFVSHTRGFDFDHVARRAMSQRIGDKDSEDPATPVPLPSSLTCQLLLPCVSSRR